MPVCSASSRLHPAPSPASNRPPDSCCICAAAKANSTGERKRLLANELVSRAVVVVTAIAPSVTHRCGNGLPPDQKWSATPSTSHPSPSRRRAQSTGSIPTDMKFATNSTSAAPHRDTTFGLPSVHSISSRRSAMRQPCGVRT